MFKDIFYSFNTYRLADSSEITLANLYKAHTIYRLKNLKPPFILHSEMCLLAKEEAQVMADKNIWAHENPELPDSFHLLFRLGFKDVGENLARNYKSTLEMFNAWLQSPTHKANLDYPWRKFIGIGVSENKKVVVVHFAN